MNNVPTSKLHILIKKYNIRLEREKLVMNIKKATIRDLNEIRQLKPQIIELLKKLEK